MELLITFIALAKARKLGANNNIDISQIIKKTNEIFTSELISAASPKW